MSKCERLLKAPLEIDDLRRLVRWADNQAESLVQGLPARALANIYNAAQLCAWLVKLESWSPNQRTRAARFGYVPTFNDDGTPASSVTAHAAQLRRWHEGLDDFDFKDFLDLCEGQGFIVANPANGPEDSKYVSVNDAPSFPFPRLRLLDPEGKPFEEAFPLAENAVDAFDVGGCDGPGYIAKSPDGRLFIITERRTPE